ncbi:MAG: hypothetical protein JXR30_00365 [Alphaproteobacteria bacterium]|nr:hypothetical protein [Alphaproteobacteria bacterium]
MIDLILFGTLTVISYENAEEQNAGRIRPPKGDTLAQPAPQPQQDPNFNPPTASASEPNFTAEEQQRLNYLRQLSQGR